MLTAYRAAGFKITNPMRTAHADAGRVLNSKTFYARKTARGWTEYCTTMKFKALILQQKK